MTDRDPDSSISDASPLRLGELLAAAEMIPDLSCFSLEHWPGYQSWPRSRDDSDPALGLDLGRRRFLRGPRRGPRGWLAWFAGPRDPPPRQALLHSSSAVKKQSLGFDAFPRRSGPESVDR